MTEQPAEATPVPDPSSMLLVGVGIGTAYLARRTQTPLTNEQRIQPTRSEHCPTLAARAHSQVKANLRGDLRDEVRLPPAVH